MVLLEIIHSFLRVASLAVSRAGLLTHPSAPVQMLRTEPPAHFSSTSQGPGAMCPSVTRHTAVLGHSPPFAQTTAPWPVPVLGGAGSPAAEAGSWQLSLLPRPP